MDQLGTIVQIDETNPKLFIAQLGSALAIGASADFIRSGRSVVARPCLPIDPDGLRLLLGFEVSGKFFGLPQSRFHRRNGWPYWRSGDLVLDAV